MKTDLEKLNNISNVLLMGVYDEEFLIKNSDIQKEKIEKKIN